MGFLQKRRLQITVLFQSVFVFFILLAAWSSAGAPIQIKTDSKALLCISSGTSVVVREASEQLPSSLSLTNDHSLQEKTWRFFERIQSSSLLTNTALTISNRIYNTFYTVTTIHAP